MKLRSLNGAIGLIGRQVFAGIYSVLINLTMCLMCAEWSCMWVAPWECVERVCLMCIVQVCVAGVCGVNSPPQETYIYCNSTNCTLSEQTGAVRQQKNISWVEGKREAYVICTEFTMPTVDVFAVVHFGHTFAPERKTQSPIHDCARTAHMCGTLQKRNHLQICQTCKDLIRQIKTQENINCISGVVVRAMPCSVCYTFAKLGLINTSQVALKTPKFICPFPI